MDMRVGENDFSQIIEADKAHVWHHLSQHKKYETVDPLIIIEGKGMRVWNTAGREHLDAVSGGGGRTFAGPCHFRRLCRRSTVPRDRISAGISR